MLTGTVVGEAGIYSAILILIVAKGITFLTGLSISAVSTNTKIEGGGAYFLISRSLGAEFGGSIGLALFFAQALSVPFYILGFVTALTTSIPALAPYFLYIGLGTAVGIFVINYVGASLVIKAQYFILAVLVLSILSFSIGMILSFDTAVFIANSQPKYSPDIDFWVVFAVFFPAVTGIMAGVNMSGDLAEPEKSIPKGTLYAIGVGAAVYFLQIVLLGGSTLRSDLLANPYDSLLGHSLFGFTFVVIAGVAAATLSSAIGSLMGAPRILQALSRDDIFPALKFFGEGHGEGDEPRRGLWLTLLVTVVVLGIAGNASEGSMLEAVAAVLTMFFLFTYGMTNMAAFIEQFSRNPSFRPRFKWFHWSTALLGAIGCFGAAVLINPLAAVVAFLMIAGIFVYISRRVLETSFGDARRGFYYQRVRDNLWRLASHPSDPKNWRPTTLVLSGNPKSRLTLASFSKWFESGRGIVSIAEVIPGDVIEKILEKEQKEKQLRQFIEEHSLWAFPEVVIAPSFEDGFSVLLQSHSIGPLKPNLLVMGWPPLSGVKSLAKHIHLARHLHMSQVLTIDRGIPAMQDRPQRIDVWWRGQENGSLMIILAYLVTRNWPWKSARIRVLRVLTEGETEQHASEEIEVLLEAARLDADFKILTFEGTFKALLENSSSDADLVLLGFQPPAIENAEAFHHQYEELTENLPTTLVVSSSGEADLMS